jgi:DnaJ-class molecular chaperone
MTADLCPMCDGEKFVVCENCNGNGEVTASVPHAHLQGITDTCPVCKGTGEAKCPVCNGEGYVQ